MFQKIAFLSTSFPPNGIRLIKHLPSYFVWEKGIDEGGRELVCIGIASMLLVVSILRGGLLGVEGSSSSCNGKNRRSHHHQHTLVGWLACTAELARVVPPGIGVA